MPGRRVTIALVLASAAASAPASTAVDVPGGGAVAGEAGKTAVEIGHIFGQSADGLILYAMILGTMLMFAIAALALWFGYRNNVKAADERLRMADTHAAQAKAFVDASNAASDALKDAATAIAASASANMTFQQSQAGMMERLELALPRRRDRP
jgi:hypothetical protein